MCLTSRNETTHWAKGGNEAICVTMMSESDAIKGYWWGVSMHITRRTENPNSPISALTSAQELHNIAYLQVSVADGVDLTCSVFPQRSDVAFICNWRETSTLAQVIFAMFCLKYIFLKKIIESSGPDSRHLPLLDFCALVDNVAAQLVFFSGTSSPLCCYWSLFHFLSSLSHFICHPPSSSSEGALLQTFPFQLSFSPPALSPRCSPLCIFISPSFIYTDIIQQCPLIAILSKCAPILPLILLLQPQNRPASARDAVTGSA